MSLNIEIKAKITDWQKLYTAAEALPGCRIERLIQEDIFYATGRTRVKLRHINNEHTELIIYRRPDTEEAKPSRFYRIRLPFGKITQKVMSAVFDVKGLVRKERTVFLIPHARIHLDQVEGLGQFMEIEALVGEGHPLSEAKKHAAELKDYLGIRDEDLVAGAYVDLMMG